MTSFRPRTTTELMDRARSLAGLRLAHLAADLDRDVPPDLRRHKGWIGRLFEDALGADGGSAARADFDQLGIELKTIPVDRTGTPRESTFVCSVPLAEPDEVRWKTSTARHKLEHILWIPVLSDEAATVGDRLVGSPLLWSPSPSQRQLLRDDWQQHLDVIRRGYVDEITAHDGRILQIRPKGASADSRTWSIGPDGESMLTHPRAFYLRTKFTASILRRHFAIG